MDWTLALAIYASVVASVGAGWQIYTEVRRRRTRIDVTVGLYISYAAGGGQEQLVVIEVVNFSEHPVKWKGFALQNEGDGDTWSLVNPRYYSGAVPVSIPPRDSTSVGLLTAPLRQGGGFDLDRPVVAKVWTADRVEVVTPPKRLADATG